MYGHITSENFILLMSNYQQNLFPCGSFIVCSKNAGYIAYDIRKAKISETNLDFTFSFSINKCFETANPKTHEPGCVFSLIDGSSIFYSYINKAFSPIPIMFSNKSVLLNNFVLLSIEENNLISSRTKFTDASEEYEETKLLYENIPNDSVFICSNPHEALLISSQNPLALVVSQNKVRKLPPGFASSIVSATFFDSDTIALSTNNEMVHLFNKKGDIISLKTENHHIIKMEATDLDCFERSLVCLTSDKSLLLIHFKSSTIRIISENDVRDFCIVHSPFDRIVILSVKGKIHFASLEDKNPMNPTIRSMIEALDSRIVTGLNTTAEMRKSLTIRENLAENENEVQTYLPFMIPLFGEKSQPLKTNNNDEINHENNLNESENNYRSDEEDVQFWIDNLHETSFELHCNSALPAKYDLFLSSRNIGFCCSYQTEIIDEFSINVTFNIIVENMKNYEPFSLFINIENECKFVCFVEFLIPDLVKNQSIDRISESYFVSFPIKIPCPQLPCEYQSADQGVIIQLKADSCQSFQQKSMHVLFSLPEQAEFHCREKTEKQIHIVKELSRYTESFLQSIVMSTDQSIDLKRLMEFKTAIDDLMASFLW
ncbi:hypothetical protein TRFO_31209 [Tritrichomonas foetus]|uniref:Uncharacterized protein n=1 Tax=Tritrichomonas foetus TaxID=1144522 RepID=A0A1J4JWG1_9EUKA|nr:hypothetical protein TRFO_31209 [Tritrichomonas foetus]|eukprot:OHT01868.1 hypothetical protein TRFO_31209 [Tritrichomonas foetus]